MSFTQRVATLHHGLGLTYREAGRGDPVLVLHGGAGPASVTPIVARLAETHHVIAPTHPGWDGTDRPSRLSTVGGLAATYLELLEQLGLRDVSVLGSSFGGWIAAEMSTRADADRVGRLILIDAIGPKPQPRHTRPALTVPAPSADPAGAPPASPGRGPTPADLALLQAYTGSAMSDPELCERLTHVRLPALVVWGEQDPIVSVEYGRDYADAFPDSRFVVIPNAGHLPTSQAPEPTFTAVSEFLTNATTTAEQTT